MNLLYALLAFIERDSGVCGLVGKLAFGVQRSDTTVWLQITFGKNARGELVDAIDADVTAALLVGEAEAAALFAGEPLPSSDRCLRRYGDKDLVSRFMNRYVRRLSPLSVRINGQT